MKEVDEQKLTIKMLGEIFFIYFFFLFFFGTKRNNNDNFEY
jgi:hypothetical protein